MAQIVAGFGVPHTPIFPHFVKRDGPDCEIAKLVGAQREQLAATRPDLIVMFDTDHLNTFFLDALPIFAIGVDKNFKAPNDEPRDVPNYFVPSLPALAAHIRAAAVTAGAGRAYPGGGLPRRLRRRHDATFFGRSLGHRAAAFFDAGHENSGHP